VPMATSRTGPLAREQIQSRLPANRCRSAARQIARQPPGFNCKPVISGFAYVQRAELLVYIRGGGAGLHPLGAAD